MIAMLRRFLLAALFFGLASSSTLAASGSFFDLFDNGPTDGSSHSVATVTKASHSSGSHLTITIDISTQSMVVEDEWNTIYAFDVSTGRPGHATPTGTFRPIRMHKIWYSSKYENAPMPWSIFFHGGYAIHGTTDIKHLGHVASHGCVRLDPKNAKLLYDLVQQVGMQNTKVKLIRS